MIRNTPIAFLGFLLATLPLAARDPVLNSAPAITAAIEPFVAKGGLAGAVTLVAYKDRVLSVNAVGFADVAGKKPMEPNTLFWIASQSKPITAFALMMLVDDGKVKLDDPITKYLPEFNNQWVIVEKDKDHILLKKPATPVTVRHILSHTSGMPFRSEMEQPTLDMLTLKDAVRSYAMTPAPDRAGDEVSVLKRRHQHGRPDHRSRQRHELREVPRPTALPTARHEGHHILPHRGAGEPAGQGLQAERRQVRPR